MIVNEDIWFSVIYGERNDFNTEDKEIIMKGLSKPNVDRVRHYESLKEMLDRMQCLYGGERYTAQEEVVEPCFSRSEPESMKVSHDDKKRRNKSKKASHKIDVEKIEYVLLNAQVPSQDSQDVNEE